MSAVWKKDPVVAICISDVHLTLKPPLARSQEKDWLATMDDTMHQISSLSMEHGDCPILCAGDIFDKWNAPAELINWALDHLPIMHSIPGNHDLPMHSNDLVHRSAYEVLVKAGKLHPCGRTPKAIGKGVLLYGTPLGSPLPKRKRGIILPDELHICLVHDYLWVPGSSFHGAPEENRLGKRAKLFVDFDVVVVGDNHMGFVRRLKNGTSVINCGTVFRRKSNEADYQPQVGLIHASGEVSSHKLDVSRDVLVRTKSPETPEADDAEIRSFIKELAGVENSSLNFRDAIYQTLKMRKANPAVRAILTEAME